MEISDSPGHENHSCDSPVDGKEGSWFRTFRHSAPAPKGNVGGIVADDEGWRDVSDLAGDQDCSGHRVA